MADYQVAIVGGGPAGLAAALTLSRSLIRSIVIDSPLPPRNGAAPHVGAYPAMDMAAPQEIREAMAEDIAKYGFADRKSAEITGISCNTKQDFKLLTRGGSTFTARRILLTAGMVDEFPTIAGLNGRWARSVINCPFCQGFEHRNKAWSVYVHRSEILAAAEVYRNWTNFLTLIVNPSIEVSQERARTIRSLGIELIRGTVDTLRGQGKNLSEIVLRDGRVVASQVLLVWPRQSQTDLVRSMGLELGKDGYVLIDNTYRTGTAGIYAAGDLTYGGHQNTNTAIHMGNMAAAWMVFDLSHDHRVDAPDMEEAPPEPEPVAEPRPAAPGQGAYDLLPERRRAV
jgi:thioredoxin reductase